MFNNLDGVSPYAWEQMDTGNLRIALDGDLKVIIVVTIWKKDRSLHWNINIRLTFVENVKYHGIFREA